MSIVRDRGDGESALGTVGSTVCMGLQTGCELNDSRRFAEVSEKFLGPQYLTLCRYSSCLGAFY